MPTHFSSIGLPVHTEEDYVRLVMQAADAGEPIDVDGGTYVRWDTGRGAELWVQIDPDGAILGLDPHFAGKAVMPVALSERITRPDESALNGAFYGWADPRDDDVQNGAYPFVFDTPDFQCHRDVSLPSVHDVQLAAFAHELDVYDSEEAYHASQEGEITFAAESFIPSGLFGQEEDKATPQAHAVFAGRVLETARIDHPLTGAAFHWVHVRTLGGAVDVVADPALVDTAPVAGGIVTGSFWLSGRVHANPLDGINGLMHRVFRHRRFLA